MMLIKKDNKLLLTMWIKYKQKETWNKNGKSNKRSNKKRKI